MRARSALLGLVAAAASLAAAAQRHELPFRDLVALAGEQVGVECERLLEPRPGSSELAQREAEMSAVVFCDCMPPALAALESAREPQALISGDEFSALVLKEFDSCAARAVRERTRRDCAELAPANAPATYCACFTAEIDSLADEEIVADSLAARDNLEQRAAARRAGSAEPPLQEGLLARIDRQCRSPPAQP